MTLLPFGQGREHEQDRGRVIVHDERGLGPGERPKKIGDDAAPSSPFPGFEIEFDVRISRVHFLDRVPHLGSEGASPHIRMKDDAGPVQDLAEAAAIDPAAGIFDPCDELGLLRHGPALGDLPADQGEDFLCAFDYQSPCRFEKTIGLVLLFQAISPPEGGRHNYFSISEEGRNRTCRRETAADGFEDRGDHQAPSASLGFHHRSPVRFCQILKIIRMFRLTVPPLSIMIIIIIIIMGGKNSSHVSIQEEQTTGTNSFHYAGNGNSSFGGLGL